MIAVGITGGIGSGKSEACRLFESLGARTLYADAIARELSDTDPTVKSRIARQFGPQVYHSAGKLNRKEMAKLVFQDHHQREKLDAILHPVALRQIEREITTARRKGGSGILLVEAALLYETGADEMFDYIIVVDAPEGERIARVMSRDSVSKSEVLERINAQLPIAEKVERADFVIRNSADLLALQSNCRFLYNLLLKMPPRDTVDTDGC